MPRVLLIEDDALMANLESVILEASGFQAAAAEIEKAPPDLILSDLWLKVGTATDTIEFLSRYSGMFPIVICSCSLDTHDIAAACRAAGFTSTMSKFDVPEPGRLRQTLLEAYANFREARKTG